MDQTLGRFLRGLTIGALIGAVIAGSRLWGRRAGTPSPPPSADTDR